MNALVDKVQVEKQFSRAATYYSSASSVQQAMSKQLTHLALRHLEHGSVARITDLGCGTGLSLMQFAQLYPQAEIHAVDLSPAMLEQAKTHLKSANFICADMEEYQPTSPQDLIFSNASVQWCDLKKVLEKAWCALDQNGIFAFSTFGPHTHKELASAWEAVDSNDHRIHFLTLDEIVDLIKQCGFSLLEQKTDLRQLKFDSSKDLLNSIKRTGATNASSDRERGLMSKQRYQKFITELDKHQPLLLTYQAFSFVLKKAPGKKT